MPRTKSTSTVEIREGSLEEIQRQGGALIQAHYEEVALHKDLMELDPDWKRYYEIDLKGNLLVLVAVKQKVGMVGYSVTFLLSHPHYRRLIVAQNDVLFVASEVRSTGIGPRLIFDTERRARDRGAQLMLWHAKQQTALEKLLPKLGYGVQDIIYSKEL